MTVDDSAGHNVDGDGARDVVVQTHDDRVTPDGADGAVDDDVALVDFDTGLGGNGLGDLGRGDGTKETTLVAGLGCNRNGCRSETTSYFLERLGVNSIEDLPALAPYLPDLAALDEVLDSLTD